MVFYLDHIDDLKDYGITSALNIMKAANETTRSSSNSSTSSKDSELERIQTSKKSFKKYVKGLKSKVCILDSKVL